MYELCFVFFISDKPCLTTVLQLKVKMHAIDSVADRGEFSLFHLTH